jgi:hypothetical protein
MRQVAYRFGNSNYGIDWMDCDDELYEKLKDLKEVDIDIVENSCVQQKITFRCRVEFREIDKT